MEPISDFKELLRLFNSRSVEYLVVGGYALAFHGVPRATGDLDLFVRPEPANAERILEALETFGFGSVGLTRQDFEQEGRVVRLGVPPVRVELLTRLSGVTWDEAWAGRAAGSYGGVPVQFIGREAFVSNKRAAGRSKDLADLEELGER